MVTFSAMFWSFCIPVWFTEFVKYGVDKAFIKLTKEKYEDLLKASGKDIDDMVDTFFTTFVK